MATPKQRDRINLTLSAVRRFWIRHPELRLCQMLECAFKTGDSKFGRQDLFSVPDEQIETQLERLHNEIKGHKLLEED